MSELSYILIVLPFPYYAWRETLSFSPSFTLFKFINDPNNDEQAVYFLMFFETDPKFVMF